MTNLLSFLMKETCMLLGITKLNTTANHPQCNGAVERFNRILKSILRKQAAKVEAQWDQYLSGVLSNIITYPRATKDRNHHFCSGLIISGFNCHYLTELAVLPGKLLKVTNVSDYQEQLVLSLSTAICRSLTIKANRKAQ